MQFAIVSSCSSTRSLLWELTVYSYFALQFSVESWFSVQTLATWIVYHNWSLLHALWAGMIWFYNVGYGVFVIQYQFLTTLLLILH